MDATPATTNQPSARSSEGKARRRWQFSLRSLLIFTALVAVWLGYEARRAERRRQGVAVIEAYRGKIERKPRLFWDSTDDMPDWLASLARKYPILFCDVWDATLKFRENESLSSDELLQLQQLSHLRGIRITSADETYRNARLIQRALPHCWILQWTWTGHVTPAGQRLYDLEPLPKE